MRTSVVSLSLPDPNREKTATTGHKSSCACTPALLVSHRRPEHWKQFKHVLQSEHSLQLVQSSQFLPICGQSPVRRPLQVQIMSACRLEGIRSTNSGLEHTVDAIDAVSAADAINAIDVAVAVGHDCRGLRCRLGWKDRVVFDFTELNVV
jgi:hypothetical protein